MGMNGVLPSYVPTQIVTFTGKPNGVARPTPAHNSASRESSPRANRGDQIGDDAGVQEAVRDDQAPRRRPLLSEEQLLALFRVFTIITRQSKVAISGCVGFGE
jgi:hypothetical protein